MDVTYTIKQTESTDVLFNYNVPIDSPYFLIGFTDPCGVDTVYANFIATGCNYSWTIDIEGTQEIYQDLPSGLIYFDEAGTWSAVIYYQASSSNLDPDNATFLDNALFQVIE